MGPDWNGDGRHDMKDDVFFNSVINPGDSQQECKPAGNAYTPPKSGIILDILAGGYLAVFIPGDIGVNAFTGIIGVVCLLCLGYRFLQWVYGG